MLIKNKSLLLSALWYVVGVAVLHFIQGLHFTTANYIVIQVLTTIGYGDVDFEHSLQCFMTLWVFSGILIVANVIIDVANEFLARNMKKLKTDLRIMESHMLNETLEEARQEYASVNSLIVPLMFFLAFVLFGAVFYSAVESCTCGYGEGRVEGCDPEKCEETGGITKTFTASVYMSVITLTTVGFGDVEPKSELGRTVAIVWMLLGVLACANFCASFADYVDKKDKEVKATHEFSKAVFKEIDKNNDGCLERAEFALFMMVKKGLVDITDLEHFDRVFASMQKYNNGKNPTLDILKKVFKEGSGITELQQSGAEVLVES